MTPEDLDILTPTDVMMRSLGDASSAKTTLVLWLREDGSMSFRISDCEPMEVIGALEIIKADLLTSFQARDGEDDDEDDPPCSET